MDCLKLRIVNNSLYAQAIIGFVVSLGTITETVRVLPPQHFLRFFAELRNTKSTPAFFAFWGP